MYTKFQTSIFILIFKKYIREIVHILEMAYILNGFPCIPVLGMDLTLNNFHQCTCISNFRLLSLFNFFVTTYTKK
jgi:hypothetical protein